MPHCSTNDMMPPQHHGVLSHRLGLQLWLSIPLKPWRPTGCSTYHWNQHDEENLMTRVSKTNYLICIIKNFNNCGVCPSSRKPNPRLGFHHYILCIHSSIYAVCRGHQWRHPAPASWTSSCSCCICCLTSMTTYSTSSLVLLT